MIYTLQEGQSFDAEILRQELVAALGAEGWHINTAGSEVVVINENRVPYTGSNDVIPSEEVFWRTVETVILAHFANAATRTHNAAIFKQITALEATQTPRRVREGGVWMSNLDAAIAMLRSQLQ